jgi:2-dehydropantoate 2-reductase
MDHFAALEGAYPGHAIGGLVKIVATVDQTGTVQQMTPLCTMTIGPINGKPLDQTVIEALTVDGFSLSVDDDVLTRLWEKWVFIAAAGIITCLFRGSVGDILAAGGENHILRAVAETETVADRAGHPVSPGSHQQTLDLLTMQGSTFTSSLYRDLQQGEPAEAEHILGGLAKMAQELGVPTPLLDATLLQLRTHQKAREAAGLGSRAAAAS